MHSDHKQDSWCREKAANKCVQLKNCMHTQKQIAVLLVVRYVHYILSLEQISWNLGRSFLLCNLIRFVQIFTFREMKYHDKVLPWNLSKCRVFSYFFFLLIGIFMKRGQTVSTKHFVTRKKEKKKKNLQESWLKRSQRWKTPTYSRLKSVFIASDRKTFL